MHLGAYLVFGLFKQASIQGGMERHLLGTICFLKKIQFLCYAFIGYILFCWYKAT